MASDPLSKEQLYFLLLSSARIYSGALLGSFRLWSL
jgi:hypothetical protein